MSMTNTPAIGEKIRAAINAGTSPKSIFKYGGKSGNGNLSRNKRNEIVPNRAIIIILINLDDCITISPSSFIDSYPVMKERAAFIDKQKTLKPTRGLDRKSTRLNSSHVATSYAVFCLKKKK